MANLTKSLDLMTDLIKAFDGEGLTKAAPDFHQKTRELLERAHRAAPHDPDLRYDIEQHLKSIPHAPADELKPIPPPDRYSLPFDQWSKVNLYQKAEAPFKQHLATDRALATVKPAHKEPVAPVAAPVHDHMAKIQELKGLLKDSYLKLTAMHNEMPLSDQQSSAVGELRNRIKPHIG